MRAIPMDTTQPKDLVSKLTIELNDALRILKESEHIVNAKSLPESQSLPSNLLDQCLTLCKQHYSAKPEPIRMVHHFACTGGALISKCIASMPNTQLLSEVDPLSTTVKPSDKPQFTPTDMIALMRQSTRGVSTELIIDLFLNNLGTIYSELLNYGLRIILRNHVHSLYCRGAIIPERPSLLEMIETRFSTKSVVTVRDPIDSFMSLTVNGWVDFSPPTFNEYCARYAAFIRSYKGSPIIRYEDFLNDPPKEMKNICDFLDLPFSPDFIETFSVHKMTGDSGRSGDTIEQRPRRSIDATLLREMETSAQYQYVRSMLGYFNEYQVCEECIESKDRYVNKNIGQLEENTNEEVAVLTEKDLQINELEAELNETKHRQRLLDNEMSKAEAQIDLIKDIFLREEGI